MALPSTLPFLLGTSVTVTPGHPTMTAVGGLPVVSARGGASTLPANVPFTLGGNRVVQLFGATVTATGGVPTVTPMYIFPSGATAVATGGTPLPLETAPVAWDATTALPKTLATGGSAGTTTTCNHAFGAHVGALFVVVDGHGAGGFDVATDFTHSVTVGGIPMTQIAQSDLHAAGADGWVEVWALTGSAVWAMASTTQTIVANVYHSTDATNYPALFGASMSYTPKYIQIGPVATENTGIGNTTAPTVSSAADHLVFCAVGSSAISHPSGTARFLDSYAGIIIGGLLGDEWLLIQDQPGAASVTPTCNGDGYQTAIDFDMIGFTEPALNTNTITTAYGSPVVTAPYVAAPTGTGTTATPGTPAVTAPDTVTPTAGSTTATPGTPAVTAPDTVTPTGTGTSATPGTPAVTAPYTVVPTRVSTTATPGTPVVTEAIFFSGPVTLSPGGAMLHATTDAPAINLAVKADWGNAGLNGQVLFCAIPVYGPQKVIVAQIVAGQLRQLDGTPGLALSPPAVGIEYYLFAFANCTVSGAPVTIASVGYYPLIQGWIDLIASTGTQLTPVPVP